MKKYLNSLFALILLASFSSCGVSAAYVFNHNQNNTQVNLSENNFEVRERVTGSSEVDYILLFGGWKKRQLYAQAYDAMLQEAGLNGSQALTNIVTEEHVGGFPPFYTKRTVTVTGQVIEFNR